MILIFDHGSSCSERSGDLSNMDLHIWSSVNPTSNGRGEFSFAGPNRLANLVDSLIL